MGSVFDINKAVAAAAFLTEKNGKRIFMIDLLKMMYGAERIALAEWGRPITGDRFASLPKGIILSRTYNLIKRDVLNTESDMVKWSQHFTPPNGNDIQLTSDPDYDYLSDREKEALERSFNEIKEMLRKHGRKDIAEALHKLWPEWCDPVKACGKKSMPLELKDILSELIDDEERVVQLCMEIQSVQSAKAALQTE